MKNKLLLLLSTVLFSCTKAQSTHKLRVITYAMNKDYNYTTPSNVAMYLNHNTCLCFPDSLYGYNTNPTFELDNVELGSELRVITFTNAGEELQYKTVVVYLDNRVIYTGYNQINIDKTIIIN